MNITEPSISRIPQQGWTLVELLVAMTLSLLLIAGIGQIYLAAKRSYDIQNSLARLQDVGRYATELLTQDIRRAGYWGLMNIQLPPPITNEITPAPTCAADTTWGRMVREKIFGFNDTSGIPPLNYACISRLRGDVLTVRYGDPATPTPYLGSARNIRTTPFTGTINNGSAGAVAPNSPPTSDHELVAHAYYVADSTLAKECGQTSSPALPALDREYLLNNGTPQTEELVTGVEQLQFQFGVDTDLPPDGSVNQYFNADQITCVGGAPCWNQVRSVRFWVLVRDDCPEPGYTDNNTYNMGDQSIIPGDGFRRALYTSTVALRN